MTQKYFRTELIDSFSFRTTLLVAVVAALISLGINEAYDNGFLASVFVGGFVYLSVDALLYFLKKEIVDEVRGKR